MSDVAGLGPRERRDIASDESTGIATLAALAKDAHTGVRSSVAANSSTPVPVLQALAHDRSEWVRGAVAANPAAPPDLVLHLSDDDAWHVRAQVAGHMPSHAETAVLLAHDPQIDVIRALARNPRLPPEAVSHICATSDSQAIGELATNPAVQDIEVLGLLPRLSMWQRQQVARRDTLSTDLQRALAADDEPHVRAVVAERVGLDGGVLEGLAGDPDEQVRTAVHRNPAASEDARAVAALLGVQRKESLRD